MNVSKLIELLYEYKNGYVDATTVNNLISNIKVVTFNQDFMDAYEDKWFSKIKYLFFRFELTEATGDTTVTVASFGEKNKLEKTRSYSNLISFNENLTVSDFYTYFFDPVLKNIFEKLKIQILFDNTVVKTRPNLSPTVLKVHLFSDN